MLASLSGSSLARPSRWRIASRQSRIPHPGDFADRGGELDPTPSLGGELPLSRWGQVIEAPPPLAGLLHPPSFDPFLALELIEQRVERRSVDPDHTPRTRLDELAELISMSWHGFE